MQNKHFDIRFDGGKPNHLEYFEIISQYPDNTVNLVFVSSTESSLYNVPETNMCTAANFIFNGFTAARGSKISENYRTANKYYRTFERIERAREQKVSSSHTFHSSVVKSISERLNKQQGSSVEHKKKIRLMIEQHFWMLYNSKFFDRIIQEHFKFGSPDDFQKQMKERRQLFSEAQKIVGSLSKYIRDKIDDGLTQASINFTMSIIDISSRWLKYRMQSFIQALNGQMIDFLCSFIVQSLPALAAVSYSTDATSTCKLELSSEVLAHVDKRILSHLFRGLSVSVAASNTHVVIREAMKLAGNLNQPGEIERDKYLVKRAALFLAETHFKLYVSIPNKSPPLVQINVVLSVKSRVRETDRADRLRERQICRDLLYADKTKVLSSLEERLMTFTDAQTGLQASNTLGSVEETFISESDECFSNKKLLGWINIDRLLFKPETNLRKAFSVYAQLIFEHVLKLEVLDFSALQDFYKQYRPPEHNVSADGGVSIDTNTIKTALSSEIALSELYLVARTSFKHSCIGLVSTLILLDSFSYLFVHLQYIAKDVVVSNISTASDVSELREFLLKEIKSLQQDLAFISLELPQTISSGLFSISLASLKTVCIQQVKENLKSIKKLIVSEMKTIIQQLYDGLADIEKTCKLVPTEVDEYITLKRIILSPDFNLMQERLRSQSAAFDVLSEALDQNLEQQDIKLVSQKMILNFKLKNTLLDAGIFVEKFQEAQFAFYEEINLHKLELLAEFQEIETQIRAFERVDRYTHEESEQRLGEGKNLLKMAEERSERAKKIHQYQIDLDMKLADFSDLFETVNRFNKVIELWFALNEWHAIVGMWLHHTVIELEALEVKSRVVATRKKIAKMHEYFHEKPELARLCLQGLGSINYFDNSCLDMLLALRHPSFKDRHWKEFLAEMWKEEEPPKLELLVLKDLINKDLRSFKSFLTILSEKAQNQYIIEFRIEDIDRSLCSTNLAVKALERSSQMIIGNQISIRASFQDHRAKCKGMLRVSEHLEAFMEQIFEVSARIDQLEDAFDNIVKLQQLLAHSRAFRSVNRFLVNRLEKKDQQAVESMIETYQNVFDDMKSRGLTMVRRQLQLEEELKSEGFHSLGGFTSIHEVHESNRRDEGVINKSTVSLTHLGSMSPSSGTNQQIKIGLRPPNHRRNLTKLLAVFNVFSEYVTHRLSAQPRMMKLRAETLCDMIHSSYSMRRLIDLETFFPEVSEFISSSGSSAHLLIGAKILCHDVLIFEDPILVEVELGQDILEQYVTAVQTIGFQIAQSMRVAVFKGLNFFLQQAYSFEKFFSVILESKIPMQVVELVFRTVHSNDVSILLDNCVIPSSVHDPAKSKLRRYLNLIIGPLKRLNTSTFKEVASEARTADANRQNILDFKNSLLGSSAMELKRRRLLSLERYIQLLMYMAESLIDILKQDQFDFYGFYWQGRFKASLKLVRDKQIDDTSKLPNMETLLKNIQLGLKDADHFPNLLYFTVGKRVLPINSFSLSIQVFDAFMAYGYQLADRSSRIFFCPTMERSVVNLYLAFVKSRTSALKGCEDSEPGMIANHLANICGRLCLKLDMRVVTSPKELFNFCFKAAGTGFWVAIENTSAATEACMAELARIVYLLKKHTVDGEHRSVFIDSIEHSIDSNHRFVTIMEANYELARQPSQLGPLLRQEFRCCHLVQVDLLAFVKNQLAELSYMDDSDTRQFEDLCRSLVIFLQTLSRSLNDKTFLTAGFGLDDQTVPEQAVPRRLEWKLSLHSVKPILATIKYHVRLEHGRMPLNKIIFISVYSHLKYQMTASHKDALVLNYIATLDPTAELFNVIDKSYEYEAFTAQTFFVINKLPSLCNLNLIVNAHILADKSTERPLEQGEVSSVVVNFGSDLRVIGDTFNKLLYHIYSKRVEPISVTGFLLNLAYLDKEELFGTQERLGQMKYLLSSQASAKRASPEYASGFETRRYCAYKIDPVNQMIQKALVPGVVTAEDIVFVDAFVDDAGALLETIVSLSRSAYKHQIANPLSEGYGLHTKSTNLVVNMSSLHNASPAVLRYVTLNHIIDDEVSNDFIRVVVTNRVAWPAAFTGVLTDCLDRMCSDVVEHAVNYVKKSSHRTTLVMVPHDRQLYQSLAFKVLVLLKELEMVYLIDTAEPHRDSLVNLGCDIECCIISALLCELDAIIKPFMRHSMSKFLVDTIHQAIIKDVEVESSVDSSSEEIIEVAQSTRFKNSMLSKLLNKLGDRSKDTIFSYFYHIRRRTWILWKDSGELDMIEPDDREIGSVYDIGSMANIPLHVKPKTPRTKRSAGAFQGLSGFTAMVAGKTDSPEPPPSIMPHVFNLSSHNAARYWVSLLSRYGIPVVAYYVQRATGSYFNQSLAAMLPPKSTLLVRRNAEQLLTKHSINGFSDKKLKNNRTLSVLIEDLHIDGSSRLSSLLVDCFNNRAFYSFGETFWQANMHSLVMSFRMPNTESQQDLTSNNANLQAMTHSCSIVGCQSNKLEDIVTIFIQAVPSKLRSTKTMHLSARLAHSVYMMSMTMLSVENVASCNLSCQNYLIILKNLMSFQRFSTTIAGFAASILALTELIVSKELTDTAKEVLHHDVARLDAGIDSLERLTLSNDSHSVNLVREDSRSQSNESSNASKSENDSRQDLHDEQDPAIEYIDFLITSQLVGKQTSTTNKSNLVITPMPVDKSQASMNRPSAEDLAKFEPSDEKLMNDAMQLDRFNIPNMKSTFGIPSIANFDTRSPIHRQKPLLEKAALNGDNKSKRVYFSEKIEAIKIANHSPEEVITAVKKLTLLDWKDLDIYAERNRLSMQQLIMHYSKHLTYNTALNLVREKPIASRLIDYCRDHTLATRRHRPTNLMMSFETALLTVKAKDSEGWVDTFKSMASKQSEIIYVPFQTALGICRQLAVLVELGEHILALDTRMLKYAHTACNFLKIQFDDLDAQSTLSTCLIDAVKKGSRRVVCLDMSKLLAFDSHEELDEWMNTIQLCITGRGVSVLSEAQRQGLILEARKEPFAATMTFDVLISNLNRCISRNISFVLTSDVATLFKMRRYMQTMRPTLFSRSLLRIAPSISLNFNSQDSVIGRLSSHGPSRDARLASKQQLLNESNTARLLAYTRARQSLLDPLWQIKRDWSSSVTQVNLPTMLDVALGMLVLNGLLPTFEEVRSIVQKSVIESSMHDVSMCPIGELLDTVRLSKLHIVLLIYDPLYVVRGEFERVRGNLQHSFESIERIWKQGDGAEVMVFDYLTELEEVEKRYENASVRMLLRRLTLSEDLGSLISVESKLMTKLKQVEKQLEWFSSLIKLLSADSLDIYLSNLSSSVPMVEECVLSRTITSSQQDERRVRVDFKQFVEGILGLNMQKYSIQEFTLADEYFIQIQFARPVLTKRALDLSSQQGPAFLINLFNSLVYFFKKVQRSEPKLESATIYFLLNDVFLSMLQVLNSREVVNTRSRPLQDCTSFAELTDAICKHIHSRCDTFWQQLGLALTYRCSLVLQSSSDQAFFYFWLWVNRPRDAVEGKLERGLTMPTSLTTNRRFTKMSAYDLEVSDLNILLQKPATSELNKYVSIETIKTKLTDHVQQNSRRSLSWQLDADPLAVTRPVDAAYPAEVGLLDVAPNFKKVIMSPMGSDRSLEMHSPGTPKRSLTQSQRTIYKKSKFAGGSASPEQKNAHQLKTYNDVPVDSSVLVNTSHYSHESKINHSHQQFPEGGSSPMTRVQRLKALIQGSPKNRTTSLLRLHQNPFIKTIIPVAELDLPDRDGFKVEDSEDDAIQQQLDDHRDDQSPLLSHTAYQPTDAINMADLIISPIKPVEKPGSQKRITFNLDPAPKERPRTLSRPITDTNIQFNSYPAIGNANKNSVPPELIEQLKNCYKPQTVSKVEHLLEAVSENDNFKMYLTIFWDMLHRSEVWRQFSRSTHQHLIYSQNKQLLLPYFKDYARVNMLTYSEEANILSVVRPYEIEAFLLSRPEADRYLMCVRPLGPARTREKIVLFIVANNFSWVEQPPKNSVNIFNPMGSKSLERISFSNRPIYVHNIHVWSMGEQIELLTWARSISQLQPHFSLTVITESILHVSVRRLFTQIVTLNANRVVHEDMRLHVSSASANLPIRKLNFKSMLEVQLFQTIERLEDQHQAQEIIAEASHQEELSLGLKLIRVANTITDIPGHTMISDLIENLIVFSSNKLLRLLDEDKIILTIRDRMIQLAVFWQWVKSIDCRSPHELTSMDIAEFSKLAQSYIHCSDRLLGADMIYPDQLALLRFARTHKQNPHTHLADENCFIDELLQANDRGVLLGRNEHKHSPLISKSSIDRIEIFDQIQANQTLLSSITIEMPEKVRIAVHLVELHQIERRREAVKQDGDTVVTSRENQLADKARRLTVKPTTSAVRKSILENYRQDMKQRFTAKNRFSLAQAVERGSVMATPGIKLNLLTMPTQSASLPIADYSRPGAARFASRSSTASAYQRSTASTFTSCIELKPSAKQALSIDTLRRMRICQCQALLEYRALCDTQTALNQLCASLEQASNGDSASGLCHNSRAAFSTGSERDTEMLLQRIQPASLTCALPVDLALTFHDRTVDALRLELSDRIELAKQLASSEDASPVGGSYDLSKLFYPASLLFNFATLFALRLKVININIETGQQGKDARHHLRRLRHARSRAHRAARAWPQALRRQRRRALHAGVQQRRE